MMCMAWWSEDNKIIIISQNRHNHSNSARCFVSIYSLKITRELTFSRVSPLQMVAPLLQKWQHIDQQSVDLSLEDSCNAGIAKPQRDTNYLFASSLGSVISPSNDTFSFL